MGKKSGRGGEEKKAEAQQFVLRVANHCHCTGCKDKIRAAVNDLTLLHGIEALDQSALESKGEVRLAATADPKKLQHRLHKATNKHVDLLFPKDPKPHKPAAAAADKDAMADALLKSLRAQYAAQQQQQQQQQQAAWANQLLAGGGAYGGYGYGAAAAQAYPWPAPQPDPYAAAYPFPGVAYPGGGGGWGAYGYPPAGQGGSGGGGAWHGHGGY
ncbi:hypothetical protein ACP4OV_000058 [Aristida adscensionis]